MAARAEKQSRGKVKGSSPRACCPSVEPQGDWFFFSPVFFFFSFSDAAVNQSSHGQKAGPASKESRERLARCGELRLTIV